jgi:hypothetical protein
MRRRIPLILLSVPIIEAITAGVLFALQRGFGGGHGDLDFAIGILLLPGLLFIMALPLPESTPDIFIILLPAFLNTILWVGIALAVRALLRRKVAI